MLLLQLFFIISILILIYPNCSANNRPTGNRRKGLRDPKIDKDFQKHYVALLPDWDSQLPEVLEESVGVQAKVKSEDSRESSIDI